MWDFRHSYKQGTSLVTLLKSDLLSEMKLAEIPAYWILLRGIGALGLPCHITHCSGTGNCLFKKHLKSTSRLTGRKEMIDICGSILFYRYVESVGR